MSKRRLATSYAEQRIKEYLALAPEQAEAIWEDLELRASRGEPIGDKAKTQLEKRQEIKRRIPKN
jgi:hypothetical protein